MLPRTLWTCWWQGEAQAPALVRTCLESWLHHNPDWKIHVVDRANVSELGLTFPSAAQPGQIPIQAFSDVLRIAILKAYGGVWVDASLLCRTPLDNWLQRAVDRSSFFAFDAPGPDRPLSSWFLAAAPENLIIRQWHHDVFEYWGGAPRTLSEESCRLTTEVSSALTDLTNLDIGVYPYFWFHYLFRNMCKVHPEIEAQWQNTPKISADFPHTLHWLGLSAPADEELLRYWRGGISPVYKLDWRAEYPSASGKSVLDFVLDRANWFSELP